MPFRSRSIGRDFGAAIAVLAVYVLVLLAPLHQAAGLQRDLARLGFATQTDWSLCEAAPPGQNGKSAADIKCPAAGIGKHDLVAITPTTAPLHLERVAEPAVYPVRAAVVSPAIVEHVAQARAPPATV